MGLQVVPAAQLGGGEAAPQLGTGRVSLDALTRLGVHEREMPDVGHHTLVDPETGQRVEADSSSAELRRRFAAAELGRRDELKSHLRSARARHVTVGTDQDWLRALGRSLR